jgi:hypothetical protein
MQSYRPEAGCAQEVHAAVCCQKEDVQQGVHTGFDSGPEEKKSCLNTRNKETKSRHFKCEKRIASIKPLLGVQPVVLHLLHHTSPATKILVHYRQVFIHDE